MSMCATFVSFGRNNTPKGSADNYTISKTYVLIHEYIIELPTARRNVLLYPGLASILYRLHILSVRNEHVYRLGSASEDLDAPRSIESSFNH